MKTVNQDVPEADAAAAAVDPTIGSPNFNMEEDVADFTWLGWTVQDWQQLEGLVGFYEEIVQELEVCTCQDCQFDRFIFCVSLYIYRFFSINKQCIISMTLSLTSLKKNGMTIQIVSVTSSLHWIMSFATC